VRIRRRIVPQPQPGDEGIAAERVLADVPAPTRKKRLPNSGSFRKGEKSRNPFGRPKGAKGKKSVVSKVLMEPVTVRLPSGSKKVSVFEALLLKERDLAFSGDWRAHKTMLELGRWALPEDVLEESGLAPATDSETDREILEWFKNEVQEKEKEAQKNSGNRK
jgi:hypothetical protein